MCKPAAPILGHKNNALCCYLCSPQNQLVSQRIRSPEHLEQVRPAAHTVPSPHPSQICDGHHAEREIADIKASAVATVSNPPLRRTLPALTSEMPAKHGISEGCAENRRIGFFTTFSRASRWSR